VRRHPLFVRDAVLVRGRDQEQPVGTDLAGPPAPHYPFGAALAASCEVGLDGCVLLLPPVLALVPHGVAPLVAFAGLCAAGLCAANPPFRFRSLRFPAAILAILLLWSATSAMWSIDPQRSLILGMRLAGLFFAGLALAAAANRIAAPRRLAAYLIAGTAIGLVLSGYDLLSDGGLRSLVSVRIFVPFRLNQIAIGLAILLLPVTALLIERNRVMAALTAAALMAGTVFVLEDAAAKTALLASLPIVALLYRWRTSVARLAAVVSVIAVMTAPLTLPRLAQAPGLLAAADALKGSAGHRLLIWSFVGDRIAERPLTGWGLDAARAIPGGKDEVRPGMNRLPLHPHNAPLQLWLELGAPGAGLFALFVGWLWLRLAAAPWPRLYAAAVGGSLTAALAGASAAYGIWQEWWLATLGLALFLILVMARAAEPAAGATPPPRRDWRGGGR
jgi:O-antigen ligase